jgi:hypothetical protein
MIGFISIGLILLSHCSEAFQVNLKNCGKNMLPARSFLHITQFSMVKGNGNNNFNKPQGTVSILDDPAAKLIISLAIDFLGMGSYTIPLLGEGTDVAFAPIAALIIQKLYGNSALTALALVEELSPGFDIVPTATIAWMLEQKQKADEDTKNERINYKSPPGGASAYGTRENRAGAGANEVRPGAIETEIIDVEPNKND